MTYFAPVTLPQPLSHNFFYEVEIFIRLKKREVLLYLLTVFYGKSLRYIHTSFKLQNRPIREGINLFALQIQKLNLTGALLIIFFHKLFFLIIKSMTRITIILKIIKPVAEIFLIQNTLQNKKWEEFLNERKSMRLCLRKSK